MSQSEPLAKPGKVIPASPGTWKFTVVVRGITLESTYCYPSTAGCKQTMRNAVDHISKGAKL